MVVGEVQPAVLVTGGAGYVGSHAAKALWRAGFRPIVLDNLSAGHRDVVRWGPLVVGDIRDRECLKGIFGSYRIRAVMHFAASAYVGESMENPSKYYHNNVEGTLCLMDAVREAGVRHFVFSSSCATYGIPHALPIPEDHSQLPVNPYGETKLACERMLRWYGEAYGIRWVMLRYFNAAGADPDGEIGEDHDPETHLLPLALQATLGRRPFLEIYGTDYDTPDGTAVRDFVHVSDLAEAHVAALRYLLEGGVSVALNLGTGQGHSVRQVIAAVERAVGRAVPVREAPRRPGDPPVLVAAPELAHRVLGWTPRHSLEDAVVTAWRWCRGRFGDIEAEASARPI